MTDSEWLAKATRFEMTSGRWNDDIHFAVIEQAKQRDGSVKWVIRDKGLVLDKFGNWDEEPLPSSRTEYYIATTRFDTKEEAYAVFLDVGTFKPTRAGTGAQEG